jgi:hypothetical protein
MRRLFITAFVIALQPATLWAAIIHVPTEQPSIQAAINAAMDGDTVEVADGTYGGDGWCNVSFGGRAVLVRSANGPGACIIDCAGPIPSRAFTFDHAEDSTSILDGLTVLNGKGRSQDGDSVDVGGAIACLGASSPTIRRCVFVHNQVDRGLGGAIVCLNGAAPVIDSCVFRNNWGLTGSSKGGAVAAVASAPVLRSCTFDSNAAYAGGAMYFEACPSVLVESCTAYANTAERGGAIAFAGGDYDIRSSSFIGNKTALLGEGVIRIDSCVFDSNLSYLRSAIDVYGDVTLSHSRLTRNGGGIYPSVFVLGGNANVLESEFSHNGVPLVPFARYDRLPLASDGTGDLITGANVTLTNCTIACNMRRGAVLGCTTATISNCIIAYNAADPIDTIFTHTVEAAGVSIICTDIYGNAFGDWTGPLAERLGLGGNICADPLFCDTAAGDLSIDSLSPCAANYILNSCNALIGLHSPGCAYALDGDGDGVHDGLDNCRLDYNSDQVDSDSDGTGNICDRCPGFPDSLDADADSVPDACDVCPGFNDWADADHDAVPDSCDRCPEFDDGNDRDGDLLPDHCDNCPTVFNPDGAPCDTITVRTSTGGCIGSPLICSLTVCSAHPVAALTVPLAISPCNAVLDSIVFANTTFDEWDLKSATSDSCTVLLQLIADTTGSGPAPLPRGCHFVACLFFSGGIACRVDSVGAAFPVVCIDTASLGGDQVLRVLDEELPPNEYVPLFVMGCYSQRHYRSGDYNCNCLVNSADIIATVAYVFKGGPPSCTPFADAQPMDSDGSCVINAMDIVYTVNYVFRRGERPVCSACP